MRRFVMHLSRPLGQGGRGAGDLGKDVVGRCGPNEGLGVAVVMRDVLGDGTLQVGHAGETVALDAVLGDVAKEPLDHVQPRGAGGGRVHDEARMLGQPQLHCGMLVGRVVVDNQMHSEGLGRLALDQAQELKPLLVAVLRAYREDGAVEHVKRGKQRRLADRTHSTGAADELGARRHDDPRLQAQLVAAERQRLLGRVQVQPDDVVQLVDEAWIAQEFVRPAQVRLEAVARPHAADRRGAPYICGSIHW